MGVLSGQRQDTRFFIDFLHDINNAPHILCDKDLCKYSHRCRIIVLCAWHELSFPVIRIPRKTKEIQSIGFIQAPDLILIKVCR